MRTDAVLDTSVFVKLFLDEPDSERARQECAGKAFAVPDSMLGEFTNVVVGEAIRGKLPPEEGRRMVAEAILLISAWDVVPSVALASRAYDLALELAHPSYDTSFLALAELRGIRLLTADEHFARKVKSDIVRVLGAAA